LKVSVKVALPGSGTRGFIQLEGDALTLRDVLQSLDISGFQGICEEVLSGREITPGYCILLNGHAARNAQERLKDGDSLVILTQVAGG